MIGSQGLKAIGRWLKRSGSWKYGLLGLLGMGWGYEALGTHNLAGQITAKRQQGNTYEITLTTYTDPAPAGVDRCSANIEVWSTGVNPQLIFTIEDIPRGNGDLDTSPPPDCTIPDPRTGVVVYVTVKKNIYTTVYTFPGPGNYELRYFDVARREDVKNMSDPGSTAFYVETVVSIPNPILGFNNTPILLNDPLDEACLGKLWTHNPGGQDPDGDSLAYSLLPSLQYEPPSGINTPRAVNGYIFPDGPGFDNGPLTMDSITGLMTWRVPGEVGTYNIAYRVEEWRNGVLLGYVIRDMVIFVKDCPNDPPFVTSITDTCVTAGETLSFDFIAYDPNPEDSIYLLLNNAGIGNNGPFSVENKPTISGVIIDSDGVEFPFDSLPVKSENNPTTQQIDSIKGTISWTTTCENIRTQFYQIDFFAHDNINYIGLPNTTRLTANHLVTIQVIPPPPTLLTATKDSRKIVLDWMPTECETALGYKIYRRLDSTMWEQDTICCETSPTEAGYEEIAFVEGWENTQFTDSLNDFMGIFDLNFCYVVTAIFPDVFNPSIDVRIETCATDEVCVSVQTDNLYMTNDSVAVTDPANGSIFLSWSQPDSIDPFFPGPYSYRLLRGDGTNIPETEITTLAFTDTTYTDINIDTESQGYNYRVEVLDRDANPIRLDSTTNTASSIYLMALGGDNTVTLSWTEVVPWTNQEYEIFRSEAGGPFLSLTTVVGTGGSTHSYQDTGLNPNIEYCYFIRSTGTYIPTIENIKQVLINDSQISCSFAVDNAPPCNPTFTATGDCDNFTHTVVVSKRLDLCEDDGAEITVYYGETPQGPFNPVTTFGYADFGMDTTLTFTFNESSEVFAGCYSVTAVDTLGNVSTLADPVCVDFCPGLRMGNVFSPNDDGINDYFTPVSYRDVVLREFVVFDRWGRKMHTNTTDIEVLWDGTVSFSGKKASDGVYYYYIQYEELGLENNIPKEEKGWVTLLK